METTNIDIEADGILDWIAEIEESEDRDSPRSRMQLQALRIALLKMSEKEYKNKTEKER